MDRGAHFHRCDLQVHTPRDLAWVGPDAASDDERREYAASLIRECTTRGLDAIAITDHHDFAFAKYVRKAAKEERDSSGKVVAENEQSRWLRHVPKSIVGRSSNSKPSRLCPSFC
jgi:type III restriction enzyme